MRTRLLTPLAVVVLAAAASVPLPTAASTPSEGTLSPDSGNVVWEGEFLASSPLGCAVAAVPTHCDIFTLTVEADERDPVRVSIDAPEGTLTELLVYSADGHGLAASAEPDDHQSVVFVHRSAYNGPYEIRVGLYDGPSGTTYSGMAELGGHAIDNGAPDCLQAIPHKIEPPVLGDHETDIDVTVHVLVDRDEKRFFEDHARIEGWARGAFEDSRQTYAPLAINLQDITYEYVDFEGAVTTELMQQAKTHLGGGAPNGIDIVFVATNKDLLGSDGDSGVAGQADCIGGVASKLEAFAVGEIRGSQANTLSDSFDSIVVAHEIGHLFGAHHHLGNCVQGKVDLEEENYWPCTVMLTGGVGMSMKFGSVNGSVVRGHATSYAKP